MTATQLDWDQLYNAGSWCDGPHIFNAGQVVRRGFSRGTVQRRTALTADILWDNGTFETVEQFTDDITVIRRWD